MRDILWLSTTAAGTCIPVPTMRERMRASEGVLSIVTLVARAQVISAPAWAAGAYNDNTTILYKVEKTCNLPIQEHVTYTVQGHIEGRAAERFGGMPFGGGPIPPIPP